MSINRYETTQNTPEGKGQDLASPGHVPSKVEKNKQTDLGAAVKDGMEQWMDRRQLASSELLVD